MVPYRLDNRLDRYFKNNATQQTWQTNGSLHRPSYANFFTNSSTLWLLLWFPNGTEKTNLNFQEKKLMCENTSLPGSYFPYFAFKLGSFLQHELALHRVGKVTEGAVVILVKEPMHTWMGQDARACWVVWRGIQVVRISHLLYTYKPTGYEPADERWISFPRSYFTCLHWKMDFACTRILINGRAQNSQNDWFHLLFLWQNQKGLQEKRKNIDILWKSYFSVFVIFYSVLFMKSTKNLCKWMMKKERLNHTAFYR